MNSAIRPRRSDPARAARIESIRDAAVVRMAVGISAQHRRLPDGRHEITLRGGRVFTAATLDAAIELARGALA